MALREIESTLPPGFRFYPSDEELVCHYLRKKVANERIAQGTLVEVDLHAREPWELPEVAKLTASEWYFFSFRDRKYATGSRTNRATKTGYWKATGKDREVRATATTTGSGGGAVVGMRKTLVFYQGRAPNGVKSCWVMHEFRLDAPHAPPKEDWVLCRVFQKRKDTGDQDNSSTGNGGGGGSSPPCFPGGEPQGVLLQPADQLLQPGMMGDAYAAVDHQPGSVGFTLPQESLDALLMNGAAMWQQYSSPSVLADHFPQQEVNRDGGCSFFYDGGGGFEDVASIGGGMMGFPQGWMQG